MTALFGVGEYFESFLDTLKELIVVGVAGVSFLVRMMLEDLFAI